MWNFVICDDEDIDRRNVSARLCSVLDELHIDRADYQIREYASLAQLCSCPEPPDILLLDVLFAEESNGTRAAIYLRQHWPGMQLLFVSSAEAFVWEAFEAYALGYILKKDLDKKLAPTISRLLANLQKKPPLPPSIPFKSNREIHEVPLTDILYIEMVERRLQLHTKPSVRLPGPLSYKGTIQAEGKRLAAFGLYHVHKSLLVNLANVTELQRGKMILCTGEVLWFNKDTFSAINLQWGKVREREEWTMSSH